MRTGIAGQLIGYFRFRARCLPRGGHRIHSPFMFSLYTETIEPDCRKNEVFDKINGYRRELRKCGLSVIRQRMGESSENGYRGEEVKLCDIARKVSVPEYEGRLLYRLVERFKPKTILELGTSVGISTLYMALAASEGSSVHTIEGDEAVLDIARNRFAKMGLGQIHVHAGTFDTILPRLLEQLDSVDFVFIDGDHRGELLLRYFDLIAPKLSSNAVVAVDDIRWSRDMESAWNQLRSRDDVSVSVDLFRCGLLCFREGIPKQHFTLRFGPF